MIVSDQQREENYEEYLRLLNDPNYVNVCFDQETGGVSAIHRQHKFDNEKGPFGVTAGDYEKITVNLLRKRGHYITLESEMAPPGVKTPDGQIDGLVMDIKATNSTGKWAIKEKLHHAAKQGAECVIFYFHKKELFSQERIEDGWTRFLVDNDSQQYIEVIKRIICVVENEEIEWIKPQ